MEPVLPRPHRLRRVAWRTGVFASGVVAVLCLAGSAVFVEPVELRWMQPAVWPTLVQSDDPAVNCGIDGGHAAGACVVNAGARVVVSSGVSDGQATYLALRAVGASTFTAANVSWDSCDLDAWAAVHGASAAAIREFSPDRCS